MYRLIPAAALVLIVTLSGYTQSQPSYGKNQADMGRLLYSRNCSRCHLENLRGTCPAENLSSTSYICAAAGSAPPLVGTSFIQRFYSVGDLYSRVKWTMPANRVNSLSAEDNQNIVAYL